MISHRYLYLLGIIWLMLAGSSRLGAEQSVDDSSLFPTAATPGNSTISTSSHKSSHHKKKKSTTATTGAAKTDVTTAKTTPKPGTGPDDMSVPEGGAADAAGTATAGTAPTTAAAKAAAKKKAATAKNNSKKKKTKVAKTTGKPGATSVATAPAPIYSSTVAPTGSPATAPMTVTKSVGDAETQITISAPPTETHPANGPEVDTGLPVARHTGSGLGANPVPHETLASAFPISPAITSLGTYTPSAHVKSPIDNFVFTNFNRRMRNSYPWKMGIYTTIFWIGEGGTTVSSTDNVASAWDTDWRSNNGGTDNPNDREGYMPANHAARMNPFYVALPFNDLAFPDKARRWLPAGWNRPSRGGKQVSACKDRWVEIKNAQGETCYAQWEDVGPLRYDHAEYVFGDERPDTLTRAGLDVSPAVADYLNINGKNCMTRWRFVDDADVQPGMWLKYDEEALIYKAMHDIKEDPTRILPIERATAPIDDESDSEANKKRLNAAKG